MLNEFGEKVIYLCPECGDTMPLDGRYPVIPDRCHFCFKRRFFRTNIFKVLFKKGKPISKTNLSLF